MTIEIQQTIKTSKVPAYTEAVIRYTGSFSIINVGQNSFLHSIFNSNDGYRKFSVMSSIIGQKFF